MRSFKKQLGMVAVAAMVVGALSQICRAADSLDYFPFAPGFYMADYPTFYTADKLVDKDGNTLIGNLDLRAYINAVKFAFYMTGPFGKPMQLTAVVPFGKVEMLKQHSSGLGDTTLVFGYWLVNNQMKGYNFGFGSYFDAPTGQYDKTKIANVGNNYWRVRPTLVYSRFVFPYDVEASLTYNINFENPDTNLRKGNQGVFDSFFGRFINPHYLVGAHFNYYKGMDDSLNGVRLPDTAMRQMQAGPSLTWTPTPTFNLFFRVLKDFSSQNTTKGTLYFLRAGWKVK